MGRRLNELLWRGVPSKTTCSTTLLTATADPSAGYLRRVGSVLETPARAAYELFTSDLGDFFTDGVLGPVENIHKNLMENPAKTIAAGVLTYALLKAYTYRKEIKDLAIFSKDAAIVTADAAKYVAIGTAKAAKGAREISKGMMGKISRTRRQQSP